MADVVASLQRADVRVTFPPAPMVADVAAAPRTSKAPAPRGAAAAPAPPADASPVRRVALADLIAGGVLRPRAELIAEYLGQTITAKVLEGGDVELNGQRYSSVSSAGVAACMASKGDGGSDGKGSATNGWMFWKVKDGKTGEMVTLDVLRKRASP